MRTRREILQLLGSTALALPLSLTGCARSPAGSSRAPGPDRGLFFDPEDLERIRANARSAFLGPTFARWENRDLEQARLTLDRVVQSGELLTDMGRAQTVMLEEAVVYLVTRSTEHEALVRQGVSVLNTLPAWDYMMDGDEDVLGLMRASKNVTAALLMMDVLGDHLPASERVALLESVAEKGCVTCHRTITHMDDVSLARGWGVDDLHKETITYDMSDWPSILGENNLRAIPTMGLGLGALALEGVDPRADDWLKTATNSAKYFLGLFEDDGSYFEGLSYVDFAFRTMFMFMNAYDRRHGDIDWTQHASFEGIVNYIVGLQNGRKSIENPGEPDIINISDARHTVFPCVPSWIAQRTGSRLAQYAATEFSRPGFYADYLLVDDDRAATPPGRVLHNLRFDLDWIVCRSGWTDDDTVVAFRSGPPMNHEHADRNSIAVKAFGERLLTDHFGASYNPSDPGWLLRLTEAHNAVLIDGQGHQYHRGEKGTNASDAEAHITNFDESLNEGDVVVWSSDATPAYQLVGPGVSRVVRSVVFIKPDVLIIVDEFEKSDDQTSVFALRFHPDNRDEKAEIERSANGSFTISRPKGAAVGQIESDSKLTLSTARLDLPDSYGSFPFLEARTVAATAATVVTALHLVRDPTQVAHPVVTRTQSDEWTVGVGERRISIEKSENGSWTPNLRTS